MTRTLPLTPVASRSLRGLPGYALRSLAELWLEPDRLARVVDAALADVHAEWVEARAQGRRTRARWIAARGNAALAYGLAFCALAALRADLPRLGTIAAGALLFPLALFWVLASAIHSDRTPSIRERRPIIEFLRKPIPPIIVPAVRVPPPKPTPKFVDQRGFRGMSCVACPAKAAPGPEGPIEHIVPEFGVAPGGGTPIPGPARGSEPIPLVRIPPEYPPTQLEGFVVVRLWVGAQGEVARAEVAQANPPRVFDRVALDAVRRWRYRPAQRDGAAIAYGPLAVMLDFKLAR